MVLPQREKVHLSEEEIAYVDRALTAGTVQSTEMLYVLVLWRITRMAEIQSPDDIQRQFTILKSEIIKVKNEGMSALTPGVYIPLDKRGNKD